MKIQSLSVVVPAKSCINDCKFCVSKMHESQYEDMISSKNLYRDLYKKDYINRLQFARDNGCNTVMLTGDCEPLQNWKFLEKFGDYNQILPKPFRTIEIQTVGNLLDRDMLYFLRHHVGVTTISLSVSDIYSNSSNAEIIGCEEFNIYSLTRDIKKYGFNLRLSLNMTSCMLEKERSIMNFIDIIKSFEPDQVTFRKMYIPVIEGENGKLSTTKEGLWLQKYNIHPDKWDELNTTINFLGKKIDKLEYGRTKYDLQGIGVVIDDDCMSQQSNDVAKYLILRPNAKLYSRWETKASLIF